MTANDGKQRLTDAATAETLLRLVQSVPSPKAEPIKLWLAKVGYERMRKWPTRCCRWIAPARPTKNTGAVRSGAKGKNPVYANVFAS